MGYFVFYFICLIEKGNDFRCKIVLFGVFLVFLYIEIRRYENYM